MSTSTQYILTVCSPDRTGIVHAVSGALHQLEGNILSAQHFGDKDTGRLFLRVRFSVPDRISQAQIEQALEGPVGDLSLQIQLYPSDQRSRVLILVSRQGHCLNDLLYRAHTGLIPMDIIGVVSNHRDHEGMAAHYQIPYYHLPVSNENRAEQEQQILQMVDDLNIDLVVLARYMQILSDETAKKLEGKAINIHHSFLPSFKGAKPYHQAHARGVKLIGATAHYVTSDLDEGPIIEQAVQRVDHRLTADELARVGSDVESLVLARAVRLHVRHRILLNGNRTVVFN